MVLWYAFHVIPPGASPHDDITREAARTAGFPPDALDALLEEVRRPDLIEHELDLDATHLVSVAPSAAYKASHHADRTDGDDRHALMRAARYIRERRAAAVDAPRAKDRLRALGQALHAAQDTFAHSSYVDLPPAQQRAFRAAVLEGAPPPGDVRMTRFGPGKADREDYGHDDHAKDSPLANDDARAPLGNGTKYDAAHDAAVQASHVILSSFLADQGRAGIRSLSLLKADGGLPWVLSRRLGAVVGVLAMAVGTALLAWRRAR